MFLIIAVFIAAFKVSMSPVSLAMDRGAGSLEPFMPQVWKPVIG